MKYLIALLFLSFSTIFASANVDRQESPQREDRLDYTSDYAIDRLDRAQHILSSLVSNPNDYQLILSNKPYFGGEAVPAEILAAKPSMIIYEGALGPEVTNEELCFMVAHELGHLHHQHMQKYDQRMDHIMNGPVLGISGSTFNIYAQKFEEREADLFGFNLFKQSGYDMHFFPDAYQYMVLHNGHDRHTPDHIRLLTSLSNKDSHFSMIDRFELLSNKAAL